MDSDEENPDMRGWAEQGIFLAPPDQGTSSNLADKTQSEWDYEAEFRMKRPTSYIEFFVTN